MKVPYFSPKIGGVRVCAGPLFEYIAAFLEREKSLGYKPESTATLTHLQLISRLNLWLARRRQPLRELDEQVIERFLRHVRMNRNYRRSGAPTALRRLLALLREVGAIPPAVQSARVSPTRRMSDEYRRFLAKERGLNAVTIGHYARHIDRFLSEHFGTGRLRLSQLAVRDVAGFVQRQAHGHGRGHALSVVTGLRSFLRFARYRGYIETDLGLALPRVANWKLAGLPRYLPREAARQVLAHCEQTTATGRRDYAILLLLARLGLRGAEVVELRLEDIDWRKGEVTVRSKKGGAWVRFPLPADVGQAMAGYLEKGRPHCSCRNVFVRIYAPCRPLAHSGVVSRIVRRALERAGVESPGKGAHTFRHTLATDLLRNGASLEEIGRVLRHKNPDTTAIYAKVEIEALRQLALPWAGGGR
jgi:site-specific recombinase XerD